MTIACTSTITGVEVYARGAVVTRRVELPAEGLPTDDCELLIAGVTPQAEPSSLRAEVTGGRSLVGLRSRVALPTAPPPPEGLQAELQELGQRTARTARERQRLQARLQSLAEISPARRPGRGADPAKRAQEMLAAAGLVGELEDAFDAELAELDAELAKLYEERDRLNAALARHDPARGPGADSATREVVVRLGPGDAAPGGVTIRYVVAAARWWPAYAARLNEAGGEAELSLDAFVVQASGEAWKGVRLALSTAELIADARLPKLPSLRFGRRQAPPRTGFRPPPEGLDELFATYDKAGAPPPPPPPSRSPSRPKPKPVPMPAPAPEPVMFGEGSDLSASLDMGDFDEEPMPESKPASKSAKLADRSKRRSAPPGRGMKSGMAAASMAAPSPSSWGGGGGGPPPEEDLSPLEPADAWLDFDSLVLGETGDRGRRGRLIKATGLDGASYRDHALRVIGGVSAPRFTRDPHEARGRFDHRFAADGLADVPSGDAAQRVGLSSAQASCKQRLVAVPVEDDVVYREAELSNPFEAPLLGGPVDVFVGASLLTTTSLKKVGRGGTVRIGLGVEDRVRIARNARVEESTSGFLSGTTEVEHRVSLEVRSSLPAAVELVLIDRVPVSGDDDVEVALVSSTPTAERYRQNDRGAVVEGGLRWTIDLPAGGEQDLEFVYRLNLPSKREVVGGNRRD